MSGPTTNYIILLSFKLYENSSKVVASYCMFNYFTG